MKYSQNSRIDIRNYRVANLKSYYSHAKDRYKKFYFLFGIGQGYLVGEASHQVFLVQVIWDLRLDSH